MKGQYISLENIFFFAIGMSMVIMIYFAFSGISDSISSATLQELLEKEGENIRANIVKAFLAGNSTNSSVSVSFEIPRQLSECIYKLTSAGGNLYLTCVDGRGSKSLNLYGIETKIKNDVVYSSSGKINIFYNGGSILIS